jgi:hypothetical protein
LPDLALFAGGWSASCDDFFPHYLSLHESVFSGMEA